MRTAVRTWLYEYNDANWKDKLTKFDGNTITYDVIGNPLNDGTWSYIWKAGRQLKSMSKIEGGDIITMEFTYNHVGLRTKKVKKVNGTVTETTEYILNGKNVVELIHSDNTAGTTLTVNRLHFYYDTQSKVALVDFNGTKYSYVHNLQGDIIGILDTSGNLVVEYKYDAWGKSISTTGSLVTTLGKLNPFRYREYVWDASTELYYLRSRYYSMSRYIFISADVYSNLKDLYVYTYCNNNPTNNSDVYGQEAEINRAQYDYKVFLQDINNDIFHDIDEKIAQSQVPEVYIDEYNRTLDLLWQIRSTVTYDEKTKVLRIPNNTPAAEEFFRMADVPRSEFHEDYDWATMMAYTGMQKYAMETGKSFPVEFPKVGYEVRVHAQSYQADIFVKHSDRTDIAPNENGFFQSAIDFFYGLGAR